MYRKKYIIIINIYIINIYIYIINIGTYSISIRRKYMKDYKTFFKSNVNENIPNTFNNDN